VPHREAPELTIKIIADFIHRLLHDHREGEPQPESGVAVV
jgi:hypothetical protein